MTVSAVIQANQAAITTLAVVQMASHEPGATRGECIHGGVNDRLSLVAVTLLIELSVPTILPQDVGDFEAIGFGLR